jgi:hypothetical protein
VLLTTACQDDEGRGCTTCSQSQTVDFELCENGNGEAVVNGENTGTNYDVYLENLRAEGVECGL